MTNRIRQEGLRLLTWLHENASGCGRAHRMPAQTLSEGLSVPIGEVMRHASFLSEHDLAGLEFVEDDAPTFATEGEDPWAFIWITGKGESYVREHESRNGLVSNEWWAWDLYPCASSAWPNVRMSHADVAPGHTFRHERTWVEQREVPYLRNARAWAEGETEPVNKSAARTLYRPTVHDLDLLRHNVPGVEAENPSWPTVEAALVQRGMQSSAVAAEKAPTLLLLLASRSDDMANALSNAQPDVFLSYSSKDKDEARQIEQKLSAGGYLCFLAEKHLKPGDDFTEEIREALHQSMQVWVLVSPNSLQSAWVQREASAAWILRKHVVRLCCDPPD